MGRAAIVVCAERPETFALDADIAQILLLGGVEPQQRAFLLALRLAEGDDRLTAVRIGKRLRARLAAEVIILREFQNADLVDEQLAERIERVVIRIAAFIGGEPNLIGPIRGDRRANLGMDLRKLAPQEPRRPADRRQSERRRRAFRLASAAGDESSMAAAPPRPHRLARKAAIGEVEGEESGALRFRPADRSGGGDDLVVGMGDKQKNPRAEHAAYRRSPRSP